MSCLLGCRSQRDPRRGPRETECRDATHIRQSNDSGENPQIGWCMYMLFLGLVYTSLLSLLTC
jgi:hypothetical protein